MQASNAVLDDSRGTVVNSAIDLDREAELRAAKVDNVSANDLLAAELQAETAAIAERFPRASLGLRRSSAQSSRQLQLRARHACAANDRRLIPHPSCIGRLAR